MDAYGNVAAGYTGTVTFSSSDVQAGLPASYTFTAADAGVHTFSATLKTAGTQSLTATDTANVAVAGSQSVTVNPAAASRLVLSAPAVVTAGARFSLSVTVVDAYGSVVTGYRGTLTFRSSDSTANLPQDYTFTASDQGVHTFTGLVLRKKGKQTITVTDTLDGSLTASVLMVTLRLIQGLCLGGELPGALTYVVETAPRIAPFVCGVVFACVTMGVAVATGVSLSVRTFMDPAMVPTYGWRIAFILGGLGGVLSFVLRRSLEGAGRLKGGAKGRPAPGAP